MKKRNGKFLLSLLALGLLLSCTQTPEQIGVRGRNSTVLLLGPADDNSPIGSGFFVEPDKIATNIHCVGGATKIRAKLVGTETLYDIEGVAASDPKNDLVILKIVGKGPPLPLGDSEAIQVGEPVLAVGNPTGEEEGQISHGKIYNRRDSDKWLRLKLKLSPGNSGGPVLNSKGEAIGVAVSGIVSGDGGTVSGHICYAIPSNTLKVLLNESGPVESLAQWHRREPIRAHTYRRWAELLGNARDYKTAIELLDAAIQLYPDFANAYFNRGLEKMMLEDYKAAIEDFDKAIELSPDFATAYLNRGNAKVDLGQQKAAIADYDKAIKLIPDYADVYFNRGDAKVKLRDHKAAIKDYDKAIELSPDFTVAYFNRGNAKFELRDYKAAIKDYDKVIQSNPDDANAYNYRGGAWFHLGNYERAIADFDEAIQLNPNDADAYNNRGLAKEALGQQEAAETDFEKAKELDPDVGK